MEPHTSLRKRAIKVGSALTALVAIVFALLLSSSAPVHASSPCSVNPLTGSSFEGGDGNLTSECATDWNSLSTASITLNAKSDAPSGSTDNSFGQGAKEDGSSPTIVSGSIPPNKNDLTRFYEASEIGSNNHNFVYLAWERLVNIGSADIDFELNQLQCGAGALAANCSSNGVTPKRTAGDVLVLYEFSGSGTPTIQISRWITSGASSQCEASNTVPCWGAVTTLSASQAQAAVNTVSVTDSHLGSALGIGLFGETAIDLTAANVFPAGQCENLGSAFAKARTSGSSFDSELKDFIAPEPVSISNCGSIHIIKHTTPTGAGGTGFGYTTTGGSPLASFSLDAGGQKDFTQVPTGSYTVTESSKTGWDLVDLTCSASGSASVTPNGSGGATATASITMSGVGDVTCTYTNHPHASPTIATTLSQTTANTGDSVHDSATLTGATSDAGGAVTYAVFTDNACTVAASFTGTLGAKTVSGGIVPDSDTISFSTPGTYYWQASYSGDTHNDATSSTCGSEVLIVKANPTIATTLSATSVNIGDSVHDSATLSGATSDAGGTATYAVFTNNTCSTPATFSGTLNPGTGGHETVTSGSVPDSGTISFANAGTYYFQVTYSGDAKNNGATSQCGSEVLTVNPNNPGISTGQNLIPNDNATLSSATANAGGTITFKLFSPSDATCSGAAAFTQTVNVNGNGTYTTTNSTFHASDVGTWRWLVTYSGDSNNTGATSACGVESFTISNG